MLPNFMLQDIFGSLFAFVLFSLIFVAPGYITGRLLDLFDFKRRSSAARFVIAIVLSMAVCPILLFNLPFCVSKSNNLFVFVDRNCIRDYFDQNKTNLGRERIERTLSNCPSGCMRLDYLFYSFYY